MGWMDRLICVYVFPGQILETEGMSVPEEVPQILQVVSEYLRGHCPPITILFPETHTHSHTHCLNKSFRYPQVEGADGDKRGDLETGPKVKHGTSTECCLSLCQAVSFLPTAEDDEEMMRRREERHSRGT
jgi:hypothetical protein